MMVMEKVKVCEGFDNLYRVEAYSWKGTALASPSYISKTQACSYAKRFEDFLRFDVVEDGFLDIYIVGPEFKESVFHKEVVVGGAR